MVSIFYDFFMTMILLIRVKGFQTIDLFQHSNCSIRKSILNAYENGFNVENTTIVHFTWLWVDEHYIEDRMAAQEKAKKENPPSLAW